MAACSSSQWIGRATVMFRLCVVPLLMTTQGLSATAGAPAASELVIARPEQATP